MTVFGVQVATTFPGNKPDRLSQSMIELPLSAEITTAFTDNFDTAANRKDSRHGINEEVEAAWGMAPNSILFTELGNATFKKYHGSPRKVTLTRVAFSVMPRKNRQTRLG